ncbi:MAG: TolC family protein [Candidatus Dependentiae bacterium]
MKKALLIILFFIIPSCKKVHIEPEFHQLKKTTKNITGSEIIYDSRYDQNIEATIKDSFSKGLSRQKAVEIALMNNPVLQSDFENLGIAKADLIQAGLYTNPQTNNVFRFSTSGVPSQTNIENALTGTVSDLWQIPFRKKIFEDELEITTLRILTTILDTVENVKCAYDACVNANLQLENEKIILFYTNELKNEIYYRQLFGYSDDLDKYNIDAQLSSVKVNIAMLEEQQKRAYIHLKKVLGITPSSKLILLTDTILADFSVPSLNELESYALEYRPEIQIINYRMKRYEHTVRYEKSRIWKDVTIGPAYKQDFDRPFRGFGFAANFTIPIFDTNYAQIAKAEFEFEKARKDFRATKIDIQEQLRNSYVSIDKIKKEIESYNNVIIPSYEKGIDYAYTYAHTLQLNMITAFQAQLNLFYAEKKLIEKYYDLHVAHERLERAYGRSLNPMH